MPEEDNGDGTRQQQQAGDGGGTTPASNNTNTCLGKAGLGFDDGDCDKCMNADGCCQKTIACFVNDEDCTALQTCMVSCKGGVGGGGGGDGGATTPKTYFVQTVYPSVQATCAGCHGAGGPGPQFFGADANATYTLFKGRGFDKPNSIFLLKGAHEGPALTAAQKQVVNNWVALESGGGGGGGGGGGDGGAHDGGADGGQTKAECQDSCKKQYPKAVQAWTDYNVCVTQTCGTQCK